jgi:hypothetical protein
VVLFLSPSLSSASCGGAVVIPATVLIRAPSLSYLPLSLSSCRRCRTCHCPCPHAVVVVLATVPVLWSCPAPCIVPSLVLVLVHDPVAAWWSCPGPQVARVARGPVPVSSCQPFISSSSSLPQSLCGGSVLVLRSALVLVLRSALVLVLAQLGAQVAPVGHGPVPVCVRCSHAGPSHRRCLSRGVGVVADRITNMSPDC